MNGKFKHILEELYNLDESLREHEDELILILRELVKNKPDTKFDSTFAESLRRDIHQRIKELSPESASPRDDQKSLFSFSITYMQAAGLVTAGVVVGMLPFSFPYSGQDYNRDHTPDTPNTVAENSTDVIPVEDNAFGEINMQVEQQSELSSVRGIGGGGGGGVSEAANPAVEDKIMPVPHFEQVRYEYVYDGDLNLPQTDELPVYKRVVSKSSTGALAGMLDGFDLDLLDLNRFSDAKLQSINLIQDKPFGYSLYIDFGNENVSLSADYNSWPNPMNDCWQGNKTPAESEACVQRNMLKASDIPADSKLIAIATSFLSEYGIETAEYGDPYVSNEWRVSYDQMLKDLEAESSASGDAQLIAPQMPWVPDQLQVIFPFVIDGQLVYDGSGNPSGLSVSVDIRSMKASGLYNLTTRRYEKSQYEVETDQAKIIELAKNGGLWPMWYGPEAAKVKKIALGEPKQGFVQHWTFKDNESQELSVPTLIFPVIEETSAGEYYPRAIIVPLVKDAIEIPEYPSVMPYQLEDDIDIKAEPDSEQIPADAPSELENTRSN